MADLARSEQFVTKICPKWTRDGYLVSDALAQWIGQRAKITTLLSILLDQAEKESGSCAVVFSQWTRVLDLLQDTLSKIGRKSDHGRVFRLSRFDGIQTKPQQDAQLRRFKAPPETWEWEDCAPDASETQNSCVSEAMKTSDSVEELAAALNRVDLVEASHSEGASNSPASASNARTRRRPDVGVILVSIQAGGAGLNLTEAHKVIIFDPTWNPGIEKQAQDRVHRIGQTRQVEIHRLLLKNTVEERVSDIQAEKEDIRDRVLDCSRKVTSVSAASQTQKLTLKQLNKLLYGANR